MNSKSGKTNGIITISISLFIIVIIIYTPRWMTSDFSRLADMFVIIVLLMNLLVIFFKRVLENRSIRLVNAAITILALYYILTVVEHFEEPENSYLMRIGYFFNKNIELTDSQISIIGSSNLVSVMLLLSIELVFLVLVFKLVHKGTSNTNL